LPEIGFLSAFFVDLYEEIV